jgi:hypothetical protein
VEFIAPRFGVLPEWQTRTFRQELSFLVISKVGADNGLDFSNPATEKSQTKITNDIRIVSQHWGLQVHTVLVKPTRRALCLGSR